MAAAVKASSSTGSHPSSGPIVYSLPSLSKIIILTVGFFTSAASAERLKFGSPKCPPHTRVSYATAWGCPDPSWAEEILTQFPDTPHFSIPHEGRTITALANVAPPHCPGVRHYVWTTCRPEIRP